RTQRRPPSGVGAIKGTRDEAGVPHLQLFVVLALISEKEVAPDQVVDDLIAAQPGDPLVELAFKRLQTMRVGGAGPGYLSCIGVNHGKRQIHGQCCAQRMWVQAQRMSKSFARLLRVAAFAEHQAQIQELARTVFGRKLCRREIEARGFVELAPRTQEIGKRAVRWAIRCRGRSPAYARTQRLFRQVRAALIAQNYRQVALSTWKVGLDR